MNQINCELPSGLRTMRRGAWIRLAFLAVAPTAYAQVGPDEIVIGEDAENYYVMKRSAYPGSEAEKLGLQYHKLKQSLAADQAAIKQLGMAVEAERFEMYAGAAKEQKEEAQKKLLAGLANKIADGVLWGVDKAKSLNPWNVHQALRALEEKGIQGEAVSEALQALARVKNKSDWAAGLHMAQKAAKALYEGNKQAAAAAKDPDNTVLRFLLGSLKVAQGNPTLGNLIMAAEFGEDLAFLGYVGGQVQDLERVADEKLATLSELTRRLKGRVDELSATKAAWRKTTGHATATPVIPR